MSNVVVGAVLVGRLRDIVGRYGVHGLMLTRLELFLSGGTRHLDGNWPMQDAWSGLVLSMHMGNQMDVWWGMQ
jgi:hypothetical protein